MIQKKINFKKYIAVSSIVLILASCQKFTELNPRNSLSETTAFTSAANIELVANGMYNTAAIGTYAGGAGRGYPFGAAGIQQGEMRGEDMINIAAFYQITYESLYDPSAASANMVNMWSNLYALINQTNIFIDGVKKAGASGLITPQAALQYEAEGRFLRALAHHELVINWCKPFADNSGNNPGVPYRETPVTSEATVGDANQLGRGTVALDYTKILADLDFAEANLPTAGANVTRATKGAAIAIKTRVKLHQGDWAGVITEGAKLGTSATSGAYTSPIGNYTLGATPDAPFASFGNNSSTERIFSIANSTTSNPGVNGAIAAMFGPADKLGRGLVATSPNLYNATFWPTNDLRRTTLQIQQTTAGARYFFNYKYRDYPTRTDYAPIIRYAEVLLNVAEAYSRTTPLDVRALNLLNAVRNRSVPNATDRYTIASFASDINLTRAILNERRIEFAGEGRRWGDIHRLVLDPNFTTNGIPGKILINQISGDGSNYNTTTRPMITPQKAGLPYSNFRFIWPIPQAELTANPALNGQQNPGY